MPKRHPQEFRDRAVKLATTPQAQRVPIQFEFLVP